MVPNSRRGRGAVDRLALDVEAPPGLSMQNRLKELHGQQEREDEDEGTCSGDDVAVGWLEILVLDKVINVVGRDESTTPRDTVQYEVMIEVTLRKSDVKDVTVNAPI